MAEFNYKSTTAMELWEAYLEFKRLTEIERELATKTSSASTNSTANETGNKKYKILMNELRFKAETIAKRRKIAKILTHIFSFAAMVVLWICIFKGLIGAISFVVGLVVSIALFMISIVSDFGADAYEIRKKLVSEHFSEIHEARRLDKVNNEKEGRTRGQEKQEALEERSKLSDVRAKLKCYEGLKNDINEYSHNMGEWNNWQLDIDNYINRLENSFHFKCINYSTDNQLVDGHSIMIECWNDEIKKIENHQAGYSQCILD